jgi:hypothetical protein
LLKKIESIHRPRVERGERRQKILSPRLDAAGKASCRAAAIRKVTGCGQRTLLIHIDA